MGQAQVIQFTATLESTDCYKCGVTFAMPAQMMRNARDQGTATTFYCPNGHGQCFTETTETRLRREIDKTKAELERVKNERELQRTLKQEAERRVIAQKGVTTRLKKRIGAGVCPCCKRTFSQLQRHMHQQHPNYTTEAESGDKDA
jgi:hypothetical protein